MSRKFFTSRICTALLVAAGFSDRALAAETNKTSRLKIYDDTADGFKQIADALPLAAKGNKRILLDFGYNGCGWCHKLHSLFEKNKEVRERLQSDYIVVYIDWSRTHNNEVDEKYGARTIYGAPFLVVLDSQGKKLTHKDTAELEAGDHHDPKKVLAFLEQWVPRK